MRIFQLVGRILLAFGAAGVVAAVWWLCQFDLVRNAVFAIVGLVVVADILLPEKLHYELHN